jgi:hypothetical protein
VALTGSDNTDRRWSRLGLAGLAERARAWPERRQSLIARAADGRRRVPDPGRQSAPLIAIGAAVATLSALLIESVLLFVVSGCTCSSGAAAPIGRTNGRSS